MAEHSEDFGLGIVARVCGADMTPISTEDPIMWLRGKVAVEFVLDPADLPSISIGSVWRLVPHDLPGSFRNGDIDV